MGFDGAGRIERAGTVDVDGDFAAEIEAGEIIVPGFGHAQPVADEDHGGLGFGGEVGAAALGGIEAVEDFLAIGADNGDTAFVVDELAGLELDGLQIAVGAGGFEAEGLHLGGDVFDGFVVAFAAGVAALQFVVGEELDVGPPAVALGGEVGREERRGAERENCQSLDLPRHS